MDASTRLYKRLGEIPQDPSDPDSLDDLIVCAFGAFERYYVCWKTKGGEFKSDHYDLPPALHTFLYPTPSSGPPRDHASLQVVFGRGEEYFASDRNGKLEYKEPAEVKKTSSTIPNSSGGAGDADEDGGGAGARSDKQALRRSRTVSFLRPLSGVSVRSDASFGSEASGAGFGYGYGYGSTWSRSKRSSSSASSTRLSRPPSLSFAGSRTSLEGAGLGGRIVEGEAVRAVQHGKRGEAGEVGGGEEMRSPGRGGGEGMRMAETPTRYPASTTAACTCTCPAHAPSTSKPTYTSTSTSPPPRPSPSPSPSPPRPTYTSTSTQTSPPPTSTTTPTPRAPLRINTSTPLHWPQRPSHDDYSAISQASTSFYSDYGDVYYEEDEGGDEGGGEGEGVVPMGRMSMLFSKPGYQLGDGLVGGMGLGMGMGWGGYADGEGGYEEEVVYEYRDTFGEEVMR